MNWKMLSCYKLIDIMDIVFGYIMLQQRQKLCYEYNKLNAIKYIQG